MRSKLDDLADVVQREFYQTEVGPNSVQCSTPNGRTQRFFPLTAKISEVQYLTTNPRFGVHYCNYK